MKAVKSISFIIAAILFIVSCTQSSKNEEALQEKINELQEQLQYTYRPGIGDLMGSIQKHHNKLWFAGTNENWELADFAIHEIEEGFDDLNTLHGDRDELKSLAMIQPALKELKKAIEQQDATAFKEGYKVLNTTCNSCHSSAGFGFIKIATPISPSLSNQDYRP